MRIRQGDKGCDHCQRAIRTNRPVERAVALICSSNRPLDRAIS